MIANRSIPSLIAATICIFAVPAAHAAENTPAISAPDLASKLSAIQQSGAAYVRLKMDLAGASKQTLQLQIKERRTAGNTDVVYQVLFPKERKGESVLLRRSGGRVTGSVYVPPSTVRLISNPKDSLLGSALSYEDVVENFFAWDQQAITGSEKVGGAVCQILESKPGKGEQSSYASVRSWIDTRRLVPLRIEKYSNSGQLVRRIDVTRVVSEDGQHIPANLSVRGGGTTTVIEGSKIKHDVAITDRDFTVEGLKELAAPR